MNLPHRLVCRLVAGWGLIFGGGLSAIFWLMSLRDSDLFDRVVIWEHFGRAGSNWYLDFCRGAARFALKDGDFARLYLALPGWLISLASMALGGFLIMWARRSRRLHRGFEVQPNY